MPVRWLGGAIAVCILLSAQAGAEEERRIVLAASAGLTETGFLKYLLPRFSLKTGIRVTPVVLEEGIQVDVKLGPADAVKEGRTAFRGGKTVYLVGVAEGGAGRPEHAKRFVDWLLSKVGQRTVGSFRAGGKRVYLAAADAGTRKARAEFTGDVARGEKLAFLHCGRCHVIGPRNRMGGLGSTPSFGVLKTLNDWELRIRGFYLLNPHPAFTQIPGTTEPFDESRPPPIVPLEITLEDLDAIMAYVATIEPARLGRMQNRQ